MAATITVVCPQCNHAMRASSEHIGRKGRCPVCKSLVEIVPSGEEAYQRPVTAQAARPGSGEPKAVSGTQVNNLLAGLIGAAATILLYALVFYPLRLCAPGTWGRYLSDLLTDRGPIQHCITLVTCWGLAILVLKYLAVRRELRNAELELTLIPLEIGLQIAPGNVDQFLDHLGKLPPAQRQSILARRIQGALQHFKHRNNVSEVQTYLASQAELEASGIDSGYTLLRVFIWVCPILGFIGTVTGISAGVIGLRESLPQASAPQEPAAAPGQPAPAFDMQKNMLKGMKDVTDGLAVAFDTTLLGLVCVIFLMFPCETLRKIEYGMLDRIEEFANESLLRRMAEAEGAEAGGGEMPQIVRNALDSAFKEHQRWLAQWQAQVGQLGQVVGADFEARFASLQEKLARDEASRLENIQRATRAVEEMFQHVSQASRSWQQLFSGDLQASFRTLEEVNRSLSANAALLNQVASLQKQATVSYHPADLGPVLQDLQRAILDLTNKMNTPDNLAPLAVAPSPVRTGVLGRLFGRNNG